MLFHSLYVIGLPERYFLLLLEPGTDILYSYWIYLSGYLFNVFPALKWLGTRTTYINPPSRMLSCVTSVCSIQCFACPHVLLRFAPTLYVFVLVYFVCGIYLGKNLDRFDSIEGVEVRQVPEILGSQSCIVYAPLMEESYLVFHLVPDLAPDLVPALVPDLLLLLVLHWFPYLVL